MTDYIIEEKDKGYQCRVILDSINPVGVRLTTMLWKYPLIVHAEACRHRVFSRSVASNRAIPTAKIIAMVEQDPFIPIYWGKNQPGMAAMEELDELEQRDTIEQWKIASEDAIRACRDLNFLEVHKQIANRVLNPYQWVTEVVSSTDWENWWALRCHPDAQPEIRKIAEMSREAMINSTPIEKKYGEWHIPYILVGEDVLLDLDTQKKVSAARIARTSYRTHEGKISTVEEDLKLYERLAGATPPHMSPLEHQAMALDTSVKEEGTGNYRGWKQARAFIPNHTVLD